MDKTQNLNETTKETTISYQKRTLQKRTKNLPENKTINKISREAKSLAESFDIADRVDCLAKFDIFITLKQHKESFNEDPKCPSESDLGNVSKFCFENINEKIRKVSLVDQWKDTDTVINWFQSIADKSKCIFMQFDIQECILVFQNIF